MALEQEQLIKILLGAFVVTVVLIAAFIFFKDTVIDFFKNTFGGEEEEQIPSEGSVSNKPSELEKEQVKEICRMCRSPDSLEKRTCSAEECGNLNIEAMNFNMQCKFEDKLWNKCVAVVP